MRDNLTLRGPDGDDDWTVRKIAVIGAGIVGVPMAALLAQARIRIGSSRPAEVVLIQRDSPTSGWKVRAIDEGRSPIGGIEPELQDIVAETVAAGLLRASHDTREIEDADVVLVSVQTDKKGSAPDYGPLEAALTSTAEVLARGKGRSSVLVVIESTLAPSSMATVVRELFARHGLREGRDILLGNSPNRVMPGRLVERIRSSDKIAGGLSPVTVERVRRIYDHIVTEGRVHTTTALNAEVVKTLENAYRDVRIAYATEIVRYCDDHDIEFHALRQRANKALGRVDDAYRRPTSVPTGALLLPTVGVGGHCLPKDGVLLWWRRLECDAEEPRSLILESRRINDGSPAHATSLAEKRFGPLANRRVAILGAAYRADSDDTRNAPSLRLARLLLDANCEVKIHDPFVRDNDQNLAQLDLTSRFENHLESALRSAQIVFLCQPHSPYRDSLPGLLDGTSGLVDCCHLGSLFRSVLGDRYVGLGDGRLPPSPELVDEVVSGFRDVERGVANEVVDLIDFLGPRYATEAEGSPRYKEIQRLAGTCPTGCDLAEPGPVPPSSISSGGFCSRLVAMSRSTPSNRVGQPSPSRE